MSDHPMTKQLVLEQSLDVENDQILAVDSDTSLIVVFYDGYTFRNLIEYIRTINTEGYFEFGKEYIHYMQHNSTNTILNQIEIDTTELIEYEFHSKINKFIIGFKIETIRNITRSIGKKDSLRIYKVPRDNRIYFQIIGQSSKMGNQDNIKYITPLQVNHIIQYDVPKYERDERNPNCKVKSSIFTKMCTGMITFKCTSMTVKGYDNGLLFFGNAGPGKLNGSVSRFGQIDDNVNKFENLSTCNIDFDLIKPPKKCAKLKIHSSNNINVINIPVQIIKSLSKLNNLSYSGFIKFIIEGDNPLKLITNIGSYGKLRIYIREALQS